MSRRPPLPGGSGPGSSGVLIAYLDGADRHHGAAEGLLAEAIEDEFAVTTLTLAEVLVVPARDGRLDAVRNVLRGLEVQELAFPADSASRLAQLRSNTGLTMPDCCVLLSAEDTGAVVAGFDERLIKMAEARGPGTLPR